MAEARTGRNYNELCPACIGDSQHTDAEWERFHIAPFAKVETVDHPAHYGGADNPYEAIRVIEAWSLGFHDGNAVKYICRQGKKSDRLEDLRKARWYLDRLIQRLEASAVSAPEDKLK